MTNTAEIAKTLHISETTLEEFLHAVSMLRHRAHENSLAKGFWRTPDILLESVPEELRPEVAVLIKLKCIDLMHSELSEATEGVRKGLMDDHLPHREMEVVELADAVIRIFDYSGCYGLPIGEAILDKMAYNTTRAPMHGGKLA